MASLKSNSDTSETREHSPRPDNVRELPPTGTSLHKRRKGDPSANISVKVPHSPSDEGSSPCTAGPTPDEYWSQDVELTDPEAFCESMLQRLKDQHDLASQRGRDLAGKTKDTIKAIDQLDRLLELLNQFIALKEHNAKILKKLRDVEHLKRLHESRKMIAVETQKLITEERELQLINEALDSDLNTDYDPMVFDTILTGGRLKRTGSKWKTHGRFGGSLLRKHRSRSAGGEESDAPGTPSTPHRRRSEVVFCKEMEKSKVSKWTRVKAAFKWEKVQCPATSGAAGAVAAGALVGAVALAGSSPGSEQPRQALSSLGERDTSLTPRSALSLTPNSSCEELRMESGICPKSVNRNEDNDCAFLQAPHHDDSSTSPSPNKMHKTPWGKMRDIIQTRRESVRKKTRGSKASPDVLPRRRRSLSDGGDSDAPPVLTLTIPSSEELESDSHPVLRKQRSLELGARPPQHRPPRPSKWTKVKRAFLTSASASVPSSPNRHSAFFTDADTEALSSGCEASGVREEIARDYAALQSKLGREFSDRRGKLYAGTRPIATEEHLSADFRKKLAEWQRMKGARQPPPVPARQDLSEDFLKKWDAWKRMKETNSVPAWEEEAKPDEVLVQTSTGSFKFQGISRSFTRKLHEWEKSRGIAPEASTSALLQAARAKVPKESPAPLTRTQSDGSVAPSASGSGRLHASSLSVNDADDFDMGYERSRHYTERSEDNCLHTKGAVLVEVEAEEICTAAPLVAVRPRHTPQKPVYTYGHAEARLLCETNSTISGTAVLQANGSGTREMKLKEKSKNKGSREQFKLTDKSNSKRKIARQPSIEDDAKFIRKTIEEIERASANRYMVDDSVEHCNIVDDFAENTAEKILDEALPSTSKGYKADRDTESKKYEPGDDCKDDKRKEVERSNGKKKSKSRARLERELSKPSESDTELDVDTVTVEIPRRRKRPRRPSERPRTPPTSIHSDTEGEIFVLKLKAPEPREGSPEVIVKTTRKIFSPVVRSGESFPRAVIPVNVEDLEEDSTNLERNNGRKKSESVKTEKKSEETHSRSKSSGDLPEAEEVRTRNRPPLPLSPSSQRKPQPKETAPSIRIMIQRYNMKISEEGHTSGASSGASSPAWRSPAAERRRPPDMPVGVNIRNNPFLEREVQKSASACQLSRREQSSCEKPSTPTPEPSSDGVLKSRSAHALLAEKQSEDELGKTTKDENKASASNDSIPTVPDLTKNLPVFPSTSNLSKVETQSVPNVLRQGYSTPPVAPDNTCLFERSISVVEAGTSSAMEATRISERAARIKAAKERFLSNPVKMRREGTCSAGDLRPENRLSRISCESDVTEAQSVQPAAAETSAPLGRSASTGMVNVDREAWERVAEGRRGRSSRSRFSLARLAAKLRRKDEGAVSRLCRQSLLVQLKNKK